MVSITHDEAVSILKAVQDTALLKIEKNAIGMTSPFNTTDDDEGGEEEEEEREEEVWTMDALLLIFISFVLVSKTYSGLEPTRGNRPRV